MPKTQKTMKTDSCEDIRYKSGFAGLLGWTNVGKSTLVNLLTGMRIAITSDNPQTTRHRLVGIVQSDNYQIALTDTPGIHAPKSELSKRMLKTSWNTMTSMDVIIWLVFPDKPAALQLKSFQQKLEEYKTPVIIGINKIDTVRTESIIPLADTIYKEIDPIAVVPFSAKTGENVDKLLDVIVEQLPCNEPLYPIDLVTDQPERIIAAEYIREQIIEHTYQEMPHVVAVEIEIFKRVKEDFIEIVAAVFVEKKSQKRIIIGANGKLIKQIGIAARKQLSAFFQSNVDLRLWIRVKEGWRNDPVGLRRFGF